MKKKKILAIDQGEYLGGAERFFSELLTRLPNTYEIHLVTDSNPEYAKLYRNSRVIFHHTPLPALRPISLRVIKDWKSIQHVLMGLIDEIEPDVIISNTVRTHLVISRPAHQKNIPLLWMMHDATFPKSLFRWYKKYPDQIIACSKYIADLYSADSVLYPYGIEQSDLKRFQSLKKDKIIGMVGNFIPWKGQELFIRMAKEIHRKYPDYRFIIIGQTYKDNHESESYRLKCLELIESLGLSQVVQLKNGVPNVLAEMSKWKILVHCSTTPEPLGRVILEGMSAGCVVIASGLGGTSEIVEDHENGILSPPDHDKLIDSVVHLIQNPVLAQKMSELALEFIEGSFLWQSQVRAFEELLSMSFQKGLTCRKPKKSAIF
jgi:glycosyltransferase involved in cell wall biosynthesis